MKSFKDAVDIVESMFNISFRERLPGGGGDGIAWQVDGMHVIKLVRMNRRMIRDHRLMMRQDGHPIAPILDMRVLGIMGRPQWVEGAGLKGHDVLVKYDHFERDNGWTSPTFLVIVLQKFIFQYDDKHDAPYVWEVDGINWWQDDIHAGNSVGSYWVDTTRIRSERPSYAKMVRTAIAVKEA